MFRAIKQVVIIVSFLLLTVFSFIYFPANGQEVVKGEETVFTNSVLKIAQVGGNFLNFLASMTSPSNSGLESLAVVDLENFSSNDVDDISQNRPDTEINIVAHSEKSEFKEFLNNFLYKIPIIYFDSKIYANSFRNFWSAFQFSNNR